jgi:hypothetical protein
MGKSCRSRKGRDKQEEILDRETEGRETFERPRKQYKMYLKNRVEGANWIHLA